MRKRKPGQAAIEYLTTYGWAILVVIVAIGALAYFGVIDVSKFIPRNMDFSGSLSPSQFKIDEGHFTFSVMNNFGYDIDVLNYSVESTSASDVPCSFVQEFDTPVTISNSGTYDFDVVSPSGCSGEPKQSFKADIVITYQKDGEDVTHTITGSIQTMVEPGVDPYCGDGTCDAGEDTVSCLVDCPPCVPDCIGKECGLDGCGGSCGDCGKCLNGLPRKCSLLGQCSKCKIIFP